MRPASRWRDQGSPGAPAGRCSGNLLQREIAHTYTHDTRDFLPFEAWRRFFPGRHLTMLEIKMAAAMRCRNFDVARTWLAADRGSVFVYHDGQEPVRQTAIAAAGDSHYLERGFVRSIILSCALCAAMLCVACQKSAEEKKREQAELDAFVARKLTNEKLVEAREREEHDRASRWADVVRAEEESKESAETFAKFRAERPDTTSIDEARILDAMVARVRRLMSEPDTMQVRYVRFNAARTAVCMEINYREDGRQVGFRQVYVTPNEVMVEPHRDEVSHRVFELNLQAIACGPTPEEAISK